MGNTEITEFCSDLIQMQESEWQHWHWYWCFSIIKNIYYAVNSHVSWFMSCMINRLLLNIPSLPLIEKNTVVFLLLSVNYFISCMLNQKIFSVWTLWTQEFKTAAETQTVHAPKRDFMHPECDMRQISIYTLLQLTSVGYSLHIDCLWQINKDCTNNPAHIFFLSDKRQICFPV